MANEKSKAEQYRDERKARIAKAAKQNAKGIEKKTAAKKAVGKVISIILVAAIAIGIVGSTLNYYGVWDRTVVIGGVGEDNVKVTAAEYEYFYMTVYNNLMSQISQYSQYGYDYGYDSSLPPNQQTGTFKDEAGKETPWDEYIRESVISQIKQVKTYYNEAVKAGLELTEADKAVIDKQVEQYRNQATSMGDSENGHKYTLNAFLRLYMGPFNESFLRKVIGQQLLAYNYTTKVVKDLAKGYSQSEIDKAYKADKDNYDVVNVRIYKFTNEQLQAEEKEDEKALEVRQKKSDAQTKKNANEFYNAVKDEKTFIAKAASLNSDNKDYDADKETVIRSATKSTISQNISEDAAKWLFSNSTKVGSKKLFTSEDSSSYTIVLLTDAKHQVDTVTVRHILFSTVDTSSGAALEDKEIAAKKKSAQDALKEWEKGDKTEGRFAAMATELSEDSNASSGGIYENILPGQMVKTFNDWIFDVNRKAGDCELVETEYGYHLIYFVEKSGRYYNNAIRNEKAQQEAEKNLQELLDAKTNTIRFGVKNEGKGIKFAENKVLKKITSLLQMQSGNSSSSAAVQ